jgi:HK97 family phage portal protein
MSRLTDFWALATGRAPKADEKALSIALAPGGFVNEIVTTIVGNTARAPNASTAALESLMTSSELVFACINTKATCARDPRLIVQQQVTRNGKVEYEERAGHPFRQLLTRPNPTMTESDLMRAALVSWDVSNPRRFYCEKVYTAGRLAELWPLNPACMRPRWSQDKKELLGYTWQEGNLKRDYQLDELLIRSAPPWYDPPPLIAALGSVEADGAQTQYIRTFFANGGIPPIFLKYSMALNETQRDDIRAKWTSIYGGGQAAGTIGILDENSDVKVAGAQLDQLASATLRMVAESRTCMVFGVPPLIIYAYVGLMRATYANLKEAWASFWDATMSPAFKEWRDFWMWNLLTEFEDEQDIRAERIRLNYDMSQVSALQDDVDAIQARSRSNFQSRLISQNEGRAALGYAPVPGGDETYYSTAPTPQAAPAKTATPRQAKAASDQERIEREMRRAVQTYLRNEYEAAADAVAATN